MLIGYMRPYEEDLKCEYQLEKIKKANHFKHLQKNKKIYITP